MTAEPSDRYHHASPLGTVACDECGRSWPCHLSAWGDSRAVSRCNADGCDGVVEWLLFEGAPS